VTDNFRLSLGHLYTFDTHFLTLGSEYGFALGGGRMAALFAEGLIGERGDNAVLAGLRIYFGQHDKTLIERNRQDDPRNDMLRHERIVRKVEQRRVTREDEQRIRGVVFNFTLDNSHNLNGPSP